MVNPNTRKQWSSYDCRGLKQIECKNQANNRCKWANGKLRQYCRKSQNANRGRGMKNWKRFNNLRENTRYVKEIPSQLNKDCGLNSYYDKSSDECRSCIEDDHCGENQYCDENYNCSDYADEDNVGLSTGDLFEGVNNPCNECRHDEVCFEDKCYEDEHEYYQYLLINNRNWDTLDSNAINIINKLSNKKITKLDWDNELTNYIIVKEENRYINWLKKNNIDVSPGLLYDYEYIDYETSDYCNDINQLKVESDKKEKICDAQFMNDKSDWKCKWDKDNCYNTSIGEKSESTINTQGPQKQKPITKVSHLVDDDEDENSPYSIQNDLTEWLTANNMDYIDDNGNNLSEYDKRCFYLNQYKQKKKKICEGEFITDKDDWNCEFNKNNKTCNKVDKEMLHYKKWLEKLKIDKGKGLTNNPSNVLKELRENKGIGTNKIKRCDWINKNKDNFEDDKWKSVCSGQFLRSDDIENDSFEPWRCIVKDNKCKAS